MFCFVQTLNADGVEVFKEDRPEPIYGYLLIGRHRMASPDLHAYLLDRAPTSRRDLHSPLLHLYHPQIVRIRGGILLSGQEHFEYRIFQPQRWWVLPSHPDPIHPTTTEALDVQPQSPLPHTAEDTAVATLGRP